MNGERDCLIKEVFPEVNNRLKVNNNIYAHTVVLFVMQFCCCFFGCYQMPRKQRKKHTTQPRTQQDRFVRLIPVDLRWGVTVDEAASHIQVCCLLPTPLVCFTCARLFFLCVSWFYLYM